VDSLSEHDHKNTPIVSLEISSWRDYLRNGDSLPDLWFHIFLKCTETFGACLSHNEGMTGIHVENLLDVRRWRGGREVVDAFQLK
jgi:hypothetical protein